MNIKCYFFLLSSFVCSAGFLCAMGEEIVDLSNKNFAELAKDSKYSSILNGNTKADALYPSSAKSVFTQPRYMIPFLGAATCLTGALYTAYKDNFKAGWGLFCGQLGFMSLLPTDCFFSQGFHNESQPDSEKYEIPDGQNDIDWHQQRVIPLYPGSDQLTAGKIKELYNKPKQESDKDQQQKRANRVQQAKQPLLIAGISWLFSRKNKSLSSNKPKKLPYDFLLKRKIDECGKKELEKVLENTENKQVVRLSPVAFSHFIKNINLEKLKPRLVRQNFTVIENRIDPKYLNTAEDTFKSMINATYNKEASEAQSRIQNFEKDVSKLAFGNINNALYVLHKFSKTNLLSPIIIAHSSPEIWLTRGGLWFFLSHCQTIFNVKDSFKIMSQQTEYTTYGGTSGWPRKYWIVIGHTHRKGRKQNIIMPSLFVSLLQHMKIKFFTCFPENNNRQLLHKLYFHVHNKKKWVPGFLEFIRANIRANERESLYKEGDNTGLPPALPREILVMIAKYVQGSSHQLRELPKDYFQEVDRKEYNQESEEEESDNDPDEEDCYREDEEVEEVDSSREQEDEIEGEGAPEELTLENLKKFAKDFGESEIRKVEETNVALRKEFEKSRKANEGINLSFLPLECQEKIRQSLAKTERQRQKVLDLSIQSTKKIKKIYGDNDSSAED